MTRGRSRVSSRMLVIAIALLLLSALGLTACGVLDPDGGKTVPMGQYAPPELKTQVIDSLRSQGYTPDNVSFVYVTYASSSDTSTVNVDGTFFGPSKEKGVVTSYAKITATLDKNGNWKVTGVTLGAAPSETTGEQKSEGATASATSASATTTKK